MTPEGLWQIEIEGGNRYPSLEKAQQASVHPIAAAVAWAIRAGLESGRFVVVDGIVRRTDARIIPTHTLLTGVPDEVSTFPK